MSDNIGQSFDTIKILVSLEKFTDIYEFVNLTSKCKGDVIVKEGNFAIDGKSLMGLYSLDLTKILQVEFHGYVPNDISEAMQKFIVK